MTNDVDIIRFTFRMPKTLNDMIRIKAKEKNVSKNEFILHILWDWAEKETNQKAQG